MNEDGPPEPPDALLTPRDYRYGLAATILVLVIVIGGIVVLLVAVGFFGCGCTRPAVPPA